MTTTIKVTNPANGALVVELDAATRPDVEAAVARARAAQPAWAALGVDLRARVLDKFRELLLEDRLGIAEVITRETGKPFAEALGVDVLACLDTAQWCVKEGPAILRDETLRLSNPLLIGRTSKLVHEPHGVVGIISPWNYPLAIAGGNVLHALLAGNAVVLKPASFTPLTALRMTDLFHKAGVPRDVLQCLVGSGREAGDALVSADIDHLVFTGSVPVGHAVDKKLREQSVKTCMELGGSDPAIVLADAPLDTAVKGIVWGRFTNCGQTCAAVKRVLVHRSLYDAFVADVVKAVDALRLGDPMRPDTDLGPLVDPRAVPEMTAFVEDARKRGGRVLAGGKARPDLGPHWFEPTVIVDAPMDARVWTEETFGPILPIAPFDTEEEAVRLANATPFGLSASVWTTDVERGERIARQIDAGTVVVNDVAYTFAANETPWMGRKDSGHGVTHSRYGLLEMTRMRHVNIVPARRPVGTGWWFPYGAHLRDFFDQGTRFLYGSNKEKMKLGPGLTSNLLRRRKGR